MKLHEQLLLPLLVCPCCIWKIGSAQALVIQCETLLFLVVILLRACKENYLVPQEGGSEHEQLCLKLIFSGACVQTCPLSQKIQGLRTS